MNVILPGITPSLTEPSTSISISAIFVKVSKFVPSYPSPNILKTESSSPKASGDDDVPLNA